MTPFQRFWVRVREIDPRLPEVVTYRRTYAGYIQRAQGAWSWWAEDQWGNEVAGSHYPISVLVKAKALTLTYDRDQYAPSIDPGPIVR